MNIWEIVWKCELTFELLLFSFLMCRNFARKPAVLDKSGCRKRNLSVWNAALCKQYQNHVGKYPGNHNHVSSEHADHGILL